MTQARGRHLPPVIDDDRDDGQYLFDTGSDFPERIQHPVSSRKASYQEENYVEYEEGEVGVDDDEDESEGERREIDGGDASNLFDEAVVINARTGRKGISRPNSAQSYRSRSASNSSSGRNGFGPPTTDDDEGEPEVVDQDGGEDEERSGDDFEAELFARAQQRRGRPVTEKRRQAVNKKLVEERPVITTKKHLSGDHISDEDETNDNANDMDDSNWLPRTRIHLTYQNSTPRVNIKDQSTIMQTVIRRAVDLGELYLVLGTPDSEKLTPDDASGMNTPFSVSGLHSIAITALIASAQEQGCDEEQDVVDRLSEGSERYYIKPLRTHVFQRLSLARTQILGRIASALPPVIKVDKKDKVFIGLLLTKSSYIFPLKEGSKDKFVNTKAYQSDIIQMSLKIGFGSLTGVHLPKLYISSNESPQERELPPFMIAVAATTAYAVLQHLLYDSAGNVAEFSTATLQSVFQAHMVRLLEWKRRHPRLFHKYAHQQYKLVIGVGAGVAGDQTTKEIIDEMDWDNMVDSEEEVAGAPA